MACALFSADELTEYLSSRFPSKYQGVWNKTVREVRSEIECKIVPKLLDRQQYIGFSSAVIDCVKWDLLHAAMTIIYINTNPPLFYLRLFEVYESGHLPCGWRGKWPEGLLRVY